MKFVPIIFACLALAVGVFYGLFKLHSSQPIEEAPSQTGTDGDGFYTSRPGVNDQGSNPISVGTPQEENFVVITRSSNNSSGVVLVQPKQPTIEQPALAQKDPAAVKQKGDEAFNAEVSGSSAITASSPSATIGKGVVVVSNYALYSWNAADSGGEALFMISSSGTWKLLSMGGGVWSAEGLVKFGVPSAIASQLVSNKPWGKANKI